MTVGFAATPKYVFEALIDAKLVSTYTQTPAVIDPKVGGRFSMFGGSIQGKFLQLEQNSRLVQEWRFGEWPENHYSVVDISLSLASPGVTKLVLYQKWIPLTDRFGNGDVPAKVQFGWKQFFWERINKILGYANQDVTVSINDLD